MCQGEKNSDSEIYEGMDMGNVHVEGTLENKAASIVDEIRLHLDNRDDARCDHVLENVTGTNRGQLVNVPNQDQGSRLRNRFEKVVHENQVDHRCFVDNDEFAIKGMIFILLEATLLHRIFEQSVKSLRLMAGGFRHSLGRTPCRSRQ